MMMISVRVCVHNSFGGHDILTSGIFEKKGFIFAVLDVDIYLQYAFEFES